MNSQVVFQAEPGTLLKQKLEDATCQVKGKQEEMVHCLPPGSTVLPAGIPAARVSFFSCHPNKSLALVPLLDCVLPLGKILNLQYTCDSMKSPGHASKYVELVIPFFKYERCSSSFQNYLLK